MALGGGNWAVQDKKLPGSYVNYASAKDNKDNAITRGTVAVAIPLKWGEPNKILKIDKGDFYSRSLEIFGYNYNSKELLNLREIFKKADRVLLYRLDKEGKKANNKYAEALYPGTHGNDLTIKVENSTAGEDLKTVITLLEGVKVDSQTVKNSSELKSNRFVSFKSDPLTSPDAGLPLSGGTDGSPITGTEHNAFLKALESYNFNVLACASTEDSLKDVYINFTERVRRTIGKNFQLVLHNKPKADNYAVISVKNGVDANLVYWVAGAVAGVPINEALTNAKYDGELKVDTDYSQLELELALRDGEFVLHQCEDEIRVLKDINTLLTYTDKVDKDFSNNQTVRILDWLSAKYVHRFNTEFLGKVPNDEVGRIALWNGLLDDTKEAADLRAIEPVKAEDVIVIKGADKVSVSVTAKVVPVNAMEKVYNLIITE